MGLFKFLKEKIFNTKENRATVSKYEKGLSKSRANFSSKLDDLAKKYHDVNEDYFNELEEILIEADCGVDFSVKIIEKL